MMGTDSLDTVVISIRDALFLTQVVGATSLENDDVKYQAAVLVNDNINPSNLLEKRSRPIATGVFKPNLLHRRSPPSLLAFVLLSYEMQILCHNACLSHSQGVGSQTAK